MRAKSVIKAGAARGIETWRSLDFLTEQIQQPRLTIVEILRVERDHALPSSITTVASRRGEAHQCVMC
jgi:hypothetical protein